MNTSNNPHRWFFALWPDEALRNALDTLLDERLSARPGRRVASRNLHITLVFLGPLATDRLSCIGEAAARCAGAPSFELVLDRISWWRQSQVMWLGPGSMPPALEALVGALRVHLADCEIPLDPRPYRAHMTLMRKVRRRPSSFQIKPLKWRPAEFVLVESEPVEHGVLYHRRAAWPLT